MDNNYGYLDQEVEQFAAYADTLAAARKEDKMGIGCGTALMLIVVGEKSRQSPLGGWEVIQRGKGKYHLVSCLPPHLSGPSQASVHGLSMLLSNWVPKKWGKIQVNAGSLDHSESQKTRPV